MPPLKNKPVSRRTLDKITRFSSCIGENTEFTGKFSGGENIVVRGHVTGESDACKVVLITETGCWDGKLVADIVIVEGTVNGDIVAGEKIELLSGSKITGNLSCPVIAIETGAVHDGHIDMNTTTRVERFEEKRNNPTKISD
ncbi:MAG: polymer-forming cytoskeletal protein [Gammaproteobacteria bacterium]|nr:polymer-forming cytoskeletal protein [Gammaproteobacteria bacterium]